jgi:hypothetical protein
MYTFYKSVTIKDSATVFLTCFSHSSKNLALWKKFAKFSGVVIGINPKKANILLPNNEKIDSVATPKNSEKMQESSNLIKRASCNKVNYFKKNDLPEYMKNLIGYYLKNSITPIKEDPLTFFSQNFLMNRLVFLTFYLKRIKFIDEQEYRLLVPYNDLTFFSLPTPKFDEKNKQYLDFQLDLSSIEEIWIDPRYFKDKLGLEEYLGSIGLSPNIVKEYKA